MTRLSPREKQVYRLLVRGLTVQQIAVELGISPRTVVQYRYMIDYCLRHSPEALEAAINESPDDSGTDGRGDVPADPQPS